MRAVICALKCLTLCFVLTGCGGGMGTFGFVSGSGTILHFTIDGGGYKLVDNSGKSYLPDNLTPGFQVDGLGVTYTGHLTGAATIAQVGASMHLDTIQKVP